MGKVMHYWVQREADASHEFTLGRLVSRCVSRAILAQVFRRVLRNRTRALHPDRPHCFETAFSSADGTGLRGWGYRPPGHTAGTLFVLHGFTCHCMGEGEWGAEWALQVADRFALTATSFDFRNHGLSEDVPPTFGYKESADISAALDEAELYASPRPYILIGDSLGAMAAQHCAATDSRVDGAILLEPPAWPWDALDKNLQRWTRIGSLINLAYGEKVLEAGCLLGRPIEPHHCPPIMYIMGSHDHYDWQRTKQIFDLWYPQREARFNVLPVAAPHQSKWFLLVDGATHPDMFSNGYHVWNWGEFGVAVDQLLELVFARYGNGTRKDSQHAS